MTITSITDNNLLTNICTLTINSISQIEQITFDHSTGMLSFGAQNAFSLSASDYIKFSSVLDNFNSNIIYLLKNSTIQFQTFKINQIRDTNNGINTLKFILQKGDDDVYNITATYPSGNVSFAQRNSIINLTFEEWTFYHKCHTHFDSEIHKEFNI